MSGTTTRRIAQLVKDLKELSVINAEDRFLYTCKDNCYISIAAGYGFGRDKNAKRRYQTIYQAFLEEFSTEEIIDKVDRDYSVDFVIRGKA